ncbi:hypothetical protein [Flavobacterium beibuense]|uniref:hypothetical protein n=1 Tax=Flavobacterium beibuense TaxID=657326 RepID=UPI003A9221B9
MSIALNYKDVDIGRFLAFNTGCSYFTASNFLAGRPDSEYYHGVVLFLFDV